MKEIKITIETTFEVDGFESAADLSTHIYECEEKLRELGTTKIVGFMIGKIDMLKD